MLTDDQIRLELDELIHPDALTPREHLVMLYLLRHFQAYDEKPSNLQLKESINGDRHKLDELSENAVKKARTRAFNKIRGEQQPSEQAASSGQGESSG